jgi:hypothetical protein
MNNMQELIQSLKLRLDTLSGDGKPAMVIEYEGRSYIELGPLVWNSDQERAIKDRCLSIKVETSNEHE